VIRLALEGDLPLLPEIERAAGEAFRGLKMDAVADDAPPTVEDLRRFQSDGRAWIFADEHNSPVAYILVDVIDGRVHIEQVSVQPSHARRGIGRQLIDAVEQWGRADGEVGLSLTTYTEVPWNGPYYERLGFRYLADADIPDSLRAIRAQEALAGLDEWPRAVMIR
jgi:GNAT superfamily N-acetyltransferase